MLKNKIKKIFWGLICFSGINFIYSKIFPTKLFLICGHSISSEKNKKKLSHKLYKDLSIDKKFLEKQIKYLLKKGYNFLNFKKIDQLLNQKKELPKKSVVMYFDDGFRDVYLNAYPVFKKYKLPFVIFITTDLIDQKRILPRVEKALVRTFLNWEEVREMTDLAEIGSHGKTHRDFINLTDEELRKELLISIQRIQKEIGKKPIALSCPHGKYSQRIKKLVQKTGFKFAATINKGEADVRERFGLKKIVIYSTDNMIMFKLKLGIFYKIKNLIK